MNGQTSAPAVALELDRGSIVPDRRVAEAAVNALANYLSWVELGVLQPNIDRDTLRALPRPTAPQLDSGGYWRAGAWILDSRSGALALTYRPPQVEPRFEYVATLRGEPGALEIEALTWRQLHPRR